jgi:hypothetical protein
LYENRGFVAGSGLVSYGGLIADAHRLTGVYAGRVLKGEKPGELPVQQGTPKSKNASLPITSPPARNCSSLWRRCGVLSFAHRGISIRPITHYCLGFREACEDGGFERRDHVGGVPPGNGSTKEALRRGFSRR